MINELGEEKIANDFNGTHPKSCRLNCMEEIWIIGLGQFGYVAFQKLSEAPENRQFVLVDSVAENLLKCKDATATISLKTSDGVEFLETHLNQDRQPDWIIPALPVHLVAEWILLHLGPRRLRRISLPSEIGTHVPHPIRGSEGNIYVSHADFLCPADCDEPQGICTVTRAMRNQNMFELLGNLDIEGFKALNIQSLQLGPGIGGYRPEQLFELMATVDRTRGLILMSTACRCHGVITGLERL